VLVVKAILLEMNCYLSKYIFVQIINKFYSPKRVTIGPLGSTTDNGTSPESRE